MKVVFNKKGFDWACISCLNPFNWNDESWGFYKNLDDEKAKVVCSIRCKRRLIRKMKKCRKQKSKTK